MRGEYDKTNAEKYIEFLGLWQVYSKGQIMRKVKITERRFELFLGRAIAETRVENDTPYVEYRKKPFSHNEDDYGTKIAWPKSYQNSPIKEPKPTQNQLIIRNYKKLFGKKHGRNVENADQTQLDSKSVLSDVVNV
jgi:hypothetical protein